jgi:3-dehydrosphinganine reductase
MRAWGPGNEPVFRVRDKNILITGGSAGIGLALAHALAQRGAHLVLLARDAEKLAAAQAALAVHGGRVVVASCDVTQAEALGEAIQNAAAALGGLDGVIANSGHCHPGNFHAISLSDADRQIDVNLKGCVYTLHHAIPLLLARGGGFIAITSSPAGNAGIFGFSLYGATKAALNNLAETLHHEYRHRNIRIHLLLPPDTQTPGYDQEVLLYPPETRAILAGGALHPAEKVAERFASAIESNKRRVTIGLETHLLLWICRLAPCLWSWYTRYHVRKIQRATPRAPQKAPK